MQNRGRLKYNFFYIFMIIFIKPYNLFVSNVHDDETICGDFQVSDGSYYFKNAIDGQNLPQQATMP